LDVGKLYAAICTAQLSEEDAAAAPWAIEGAVAPSGFVSSDGLAKWAEQCFAFSSDLMHAHTGLSLAALCECAFAAPAPPAAEGEEAPAVTPLALVLVQGLHESCVALAGIAAEEQTDAPVEE